jgi:hypothetical protein
VASVISTTIVEWVGGKVPQKVAPTNPQQASPDSAASAGV